MNFIWLFFKIKMEQDSWDVDIHLYPHAVSKEIAIIGQKSLWFMY